MRPSARVLISLLPRPARVPPRLVRLNHTPNQAEDELRFSRQAAHTIQEAYEDIGRETAAEVLEDSLFYWAEERIRRAQAQHSCVKSLQMVCQRRARLRFKRDLTVSRLSVMQEGRNCGRGRANRCWQRLRR